MKTRVIYLLLLPAISISLFITTTASAFWVWTPQSNKFQNPKNVVKDSPKEQFDWAMDLFEKKDYERAVVEFEKLTKQYQYSEYAPKAQYYVGVCYELMGKFYIAFQNYQKAITDFPHIDNIDEIIAREFNIANMYLVKANPKVMGADIMTQLDRAIEIYRCIVENAPYGNLADQAQFRLGEALKKAEKYDEAVLAFQRLMDDYPDSKLLEKARYELAYCSYRASLRPAYDSASTEKAIDNLKDFIKSTENEELSKEARETMGRLKDRAAQKSFDIAQFYERQKHYDSAVIYYEDVISNYPNSSFVKEATARIGRLRQLQNKGSKK